MSLNLNATLGPRYNLNVTQARALNMSVVACGNDNKTLTINTPAQFTLGVGVASTGGGGAFVSSDSGNAILTGGDGGMFVEVNPLSSVQW